MVFYLAMNLAMNPCPPGPSRTARVSPSTAPNWRERSGRWANSRRTGFPFTSAKWFATSTLPGSSPQWFDDTWSVLDDLRSSGWALWEFSRTVRCSRYAARRHKVRRLPRPPAQPRASRPAAEKNEGVESDRPPRRHALLCVLRGMCLRTKRVKSSCGSGSPGLPPECAERILSLADDFRGNGIQPASQSVSRGRLRPSPW